MKWYNPFAFVPGVVTIITGVVYLAIAIALVAVHESVPPAPANPTGHAGLNLTEAWKDLRHLTRYFHPFNSRKNDDVRNWLLLRFGNILQDNEVDFEVEIDTGTSSSGSVSSKIDSDVDFYNHARSARTDCDNMDPYERWRCRSPAVTVFNDQVCNYTTTFPPRVYEKDRPHAMSTYFESSNIIVYIRGTEDEEGEWWKSEHWTRTRVHGKGGVMVNTHFDSVSTAFGATDAGIGVITALQLIKYFTTEGHTPRKGVVILLNNNEEDGLYGGMAFLEHPMASFVHTFLNLEGAGAGGRAILFRSTDTEVTRAYAKARHPLGTVLANDAYAQGIIRSETDYSIFKPAGYRGLDVAFWHPRARYHTYEDDARDTSLASVWDMLSMSVETVKSLTSDMSDQFIGPNRGHNRDHVRNGKGSDGVYFDIFGATMAVFQQRTLFAWSLTTLIASPLILALLTYLLIRNDKYYLFTNHTDAHGQDADTIYIGGWRGFSRFPIAVVVASAVTIGAALLLKKVNPLIIYSAPYSVWAMSLSLFFVSYWFLMAGSNFMRPSALHRCYVLIWMFTLGWGILVVATILEDRFKLSGGYLLVFYEAAIFLALVISLCEMFALPTKESLATTQTQDAQDESGTALTGESDSQVATTPDELGEASQETAEEPTETTSLLGGDSQRRSPLTTFNRYRRSLAQSTAGENHVLCSQHKSFGNEQHWAAPLPTWTWLLQFLIIGPFNMVLIGNVGLVFLTAINQTGTDGSPLLLPYLLVATFTILWVLPIAPFAHRITRQVPVLLIVVFIFTLIYNLTTFPFTPESKFKAYFQQKVDLDSGLNRVTLAGLEKYVTKMIDAMPSAADQNITCESNPQRRSGISFCSWNGIPPEVVDGIPDGIPPEKYYANWLTYNATRVAHDNKATFQITGRETRGCVLRFDEPISAFHVHGAAKQNEKWSDVPVSGTDEIKLWSRDWDKIWTVDVEWLPSNGRQPGEEGRSGHVVCLWSDHNGPGIIPALDEVLGYCPVWSTVTKLTDGLVEGSKAFII